MPTTITPHARWPLAPLHVALALLALAAGCDRAPDPADRLPAPRAARRADGWYGTRMPEPAARPVVALAGERGPWTLAGERGRVVLLFFGFTNCPDICPTTLADWRRVRHALGADSARVRFVFASVDPERDPPPVAAAYARRFDPSFTGVSGSRAEVERALAAFQSTAYRQPAPAPATPVPAGHDHDAYLVSHPSRVFVIDAEGAWRLTLSPDAGPRATLDDVRKLLD